MAAGILNIYGADLASRAACCVMLTCEDEPEGLAKDDRWPSPAERAAQLARWVEGDLDILDHAIGLVRDRMTAGPVIEDRGDLPRVNFGRSLVILTNARRIASGR